MGAVEDAVTRLTAQIPSRTVYPYAAPDGNLPARYLVVYGSDGTEESNRLTQTVNVLRPAVWVVSVARNLRPEVAAREAAWGASKARTALRDYRPSGSYAFRHETGDTSPRRDDTASTTTFVAAEQFSIRTAI